MGYDTIEDLCVKQKQFFFSGKTKSVDFRIRSLKRLKSVLKKYFLDITDSMYKDFGKSEFESYATEIVGVIDELNFAIRHLQSWIAPKKVKTPPLLFKSRSYVYTEPYGIVLIITAWNYPFLLAITPLIASIAAGNCSIIKPSELSFHTSKVLSCIIGEAFDEQFCAVVEGGEEEISELLKQKIDFIHFTGSVRIGKIIAVSAAKQLIPVILELGGKSPCIVDNTANLEVAARRIVWGKFVNSGQTCVAPDYLLVQKSIKKEFLDLIRKQIIEFYGDVFDGNRDYCSIINLKNFERLEQLIADKGNIIIGGRVDKEQLKIEPTVIDQVEWEDSIMKEEIFGPILPVIDFEHIDEVIDQINNSNLSKPLALYYFTRNKKEQEKMISQISFGGGCMNATLMHIVNPNLPFGGVGKSGVGNYHGKWGFDSFSLKKSIVIKSTIFDIRFLYPPYKNKVNIIKKLY